MSAGTHPGAALLVVFMKVRRHELLELRWLPGEVPCVGFHGLVCAVSVDGFFWPACLPLNLALMNPPQGMGGSTALGPKFNPGLFEAKCLLPCAALSV